MKTEHKQYNTLLIFKKGTFYTAYNDNAIILHFLFGYKISFEGRVGFSESAFTKVINTLGNKNIDYQFIYKDKELIIKSFGKLNKYKKILNNAIEYHSILDKERISI